MRIKLLEKLASKWRYAESDYLNTQDDTEKIKVGKIQKKAKLSARETRWLEAMCNSMGV